MPRYPDTSRIVRRPCDQQTPLSIFRADDLSPFGGTSASIKLVVADNHPLFRAALCSAVLRLLPEASIVEAGSVRELEAALLAYPTVDLVLLDLRLPDAQGFAQLVGLRQRFPAVPIAIVSTVDSGSVVDRAVAFGASGFIPKSASIKTIVMMLRALLGGQIALPTNYVASSPHPLDDRKLGRTVAKLSRRQLQVLALIAEGCSNKTIAQGLAISETTVKDHVAVILRKLGVERRIHAALLAERLFHI
jgi:DNA-binding NarL/FixJ family response regulator